MNTTVAAVNKDNLSEYPQSICFINPKHELYHKKVEWLHDQFEHGLKIKLLYIEGQTKPVGFVEYLPGEQCWRAVDAEGYMFIHCLWTNGKKFQHQRLGSRLLEAVETSGREQLVVKSFGSSPMPRLRDWQGELEKYQGLHIVYSRQCPWVARFIEEIKPILAEHRLEPVITELQTAAEAQQAPSVYAVFNLIYNGKLLADRYISTTRFQNILKKELV